MKDQLHQVDGALVWVNPIDADGNSRDPLDAMLLDVAAAGVLCSVAPLPDSAIESLVSATTAHPAYARGRR